MTDFFKQLFNQTPSYDNSLFQYFTTPSLFNSATQPLKGTNTNKTINPDKANKIKDILINNQQPINAPLLSVNDFNQVKTYDNQMQNQRQSQIQYSSGQSLATIPNAQLQIVTQINELKDNNFVFTLNTPVQVDLDKLFQTQMQQTSRFQKIRNKYTSSGNKQISLLALACLLGLEGIVAYFVYNGAVPGVLNNNNKDAGYIFIYNQIKNGLLTLNKVKLILLILCSVKNGADLSRLVKGQIKSNGKDAEIQKSVLHLLVENFLLPVSDSQADLQRSNRVQALVTLGLKPNTNPSPQNINKAYRQRALQTHPNKTQNNKTAQFQRVHNAYKYLSQQPSITGGDSSTNMVPYGSLSGQSLQSLPGQKYLGYELLKFILQLNSQKLPNKSIINFYSDINALSTPFELSPLFTLLLFPPDFSKIPQSSSNPLSEIVQLFLDKKASTTSIPNPKQISSFNICEFLQIDTRLDQNTKKVLMSNSSIQKACNTTFGMSQNQKKFKELQQKYSKLLALYARNTDQPQNKINQSLSNSYLVNSSYGNPPPPQHAGTTTKLRTFHFADNKKYSHNVFRAIKPINAGRLAFEFIRDHYRIGGKEIVFTIMDKHNKKHYKYVARNDRKLGVVIHTFK
jgi:curved DNA-binding protein CbpA